MKTSGSPLLEPDASPDVLSAVLVAHLPAIKGLVRAVHRRFGGAGDDERELLSDVLFRLVEQDYGVLRKFRGGSSLRTYLYTVICRVQLDRRVRMWGKWRPTSRAARLGDAARHLERLVARDRLTPQEAIGAVAYDPRAGLDFATVNRLYAKLDVRPRPRQVPLDGWADRLADLPADDPCATSDLRRRAARLTLALQRAVSALDPPDRYLLGLRYREGRSVADIARVLGRDPKRLYRRYDWVLRRLRAELLRAEIGADEARQLVGHLHVEMGAILTDATPAA